MTTEFKKIIVNDEVYRIMRQKVIKYDGHVYAKTSPWVRSNGETVSYRKFIEAHPDLVVNKDIVEEV